ncbi:MAG: hypothetical protein ACRC9Y_09140 [Aeromonas veronii]
MKDIIEVEYKPSHALQIATKEYYELRLLAEQKNKTMAEVLRDLIGQAYGATNSPKVVVINKPRRGRPIKPVMDLEQLK